MRPIENTIQTILYTIVVIAYMLMCIFGLYSFLMPPKGLANTPAGQITVLGISTMAGYMICFATAIIGLMLSLKNRLKAKMTGCIMCIPYMISVVNFLIVFIDMKIKQNGYISLQGWITDFAVPVIFAIFIILFFCIEDRRLPYVIIFLIALLSISYIALVLKDTFNRITDLGFVVRTVHVMGKIGMIFLLGYQGYVWDSKKKVAYRERG